MQSDSDQVLKRMAPLRITKRRFHRLSGGLALWGVSIAALFAIGLGLIVLIKLFASEDSSYTDPSGFWAGVGERIVKSHAYDKTLSEGLLSFWKSEDAVSIIDLGAGMGLYSRDAMAANILTSCYVKDLKTFEISEGRCAIVDLTQPINFSKHDWALSLEAGEHISKEFEDIFIGNLDRVNKKGIVISWAAEKEEGIEHVNLRSNNYIIDKIQKLGYEVDMEAQSVLRTAARKSYFKDTIMVFRSTKNKSTGILGSLFG